MYHPLAINTKLLPTFESINIEENKYQSEKQRKEDMVRYASAKFFIDIKLKTNTWINGSKPTIVDRDAFLHFQGVPIEESLHPRLHAWYEKVKGYTEEARNNWPESDGLEVVKE